MTDRPSRTATWFRTGYIVVLLIACGVVILDQLAKYWALTNLQGRPPVEVVGEVLRLTFTRNPGGAFSLGTGLTWVFTTVAVCVALVIVWFARKVTNRWWIAALGVLLGGAIGNLVDRITQPPGFGVGHVVDFLQLPNWPVFNIADMAVVGGASAIVILSLLGVEPIRAPRSTDPRVTSALVTEPIGD